MGNKLMKYIKVIIMFPIAIFGLLLLMVADLVRMVQGKPTVDAEWHNDYVDNNMSHGQGRRE